MRRVVWLAAVVALLGWAGADSPLWAQQPTPPAPPTRPAGTPAPEAPGAEAGQTASKPDSAEEAGEVELPVSLDRIRRRAADERATVFTLPEREIPTFAIEVERRVPTFWDFVQPGELDPGPIGPSSPYHTEMMNLITPPVARPYGAFTGGNLLLVALQSLFTGYVGQQVPGWIEEAMRAQREAEARREVQAVVEELERRKRAAEAAERARQAPRQETVPPEEQ
jgi:hypothetical protein